VVDTIGIENFCGNIDEALRKSCEIMANHENKDSVVTT
jgi:hypothetical protein